MANHPNRAKSYTSLTVFTAGKERSKRFAGIADDATLQEWMRQHGYSDGNAHFYSKDGGYYSRTVRCSLSDADKFHAS